MKKTISLVLISLFSLSVFSQISDQSIWDKIQKFNNDANSAVKNKDHKKAIVIYDSLISYYNSLPDKNKDIFTPFLGGIYYNRSCYNSILNNKDKALEDLEKAVEHSWNDYRHTLGDSDMTNIRNEKRFKDLVAKMKKNGDYLQVLKDAPGYTKDLPKQKIEFTYLEASDPDLVRIRQYFNLDSIAGKGDEISQIKKLMTWVHNRVRHDGGSSNPSPKNSINIVKVCDAEKRGVNCRMMATMLNECYLAMGFKSRFITCMPKKYVSDCHVINAVYSKTLNKWLWMDPTFNAYVSDDKGNLLSIAEVRERLRTDKPIVLNEDANWNNESKQTKEQYLDSYMAKNLYWISSPLHNGYNVETAGTTNGFLNLYPADYVPDPVRNDYITTNDKLFWEE